MDSGPRAQTGRLRPLAADPADGRPVAGRHARRRRRAASGDGGAESEPDFSTTNVQEAGVDEPDTVKTDGRRVFAIAGSRFVDLDGRAASARARGR